MGGKQSRVTEGRIREELDQKLSSIRSDLSSTRASLGASRNEVESLKQQLSTSQRTLQSMNTQLAFTNSEVVSTKTRLKSSLDELSELREQMLTREKLQSDIGTKLCRMIELENRVHSSMFEVLSSRINLEVSNIDVNALGEEVVSCDKFHEDMKMKLDEVIELENKLCSINIELVDINSGLTASETDESELKNEVLARHKFDQDMGIKLCDILELQKEVDWSSSQASLAKDCFEEMKREENELKEQVLTCEKFQKDMERKLLRIMQLEKDVCETSSEALVDKSSIESLKNEESVLKKQLFDELKFEEQMRIDVKKMLGLEG